MPTGNTVPWLWRYPYPDLHMGPRVWVDNFPPFGAGYEPEPAESHHHQAGVPDQQYDATGSSDVAWADGGTKDETDWTEESAAADASSEVSLAGAAASGWTEESLVADAWSEAGSPSADTAVETSLSGDTASEVTSTGGTWTETDLSPAGTWTEEAEPTDDWTEEF